MCNGIIVMFVIFTKDLIQIVNSVASPFVFLGVKGLLFLLTQDNKIYKLRFLNN
jgi:hypothetical protein